MRRRDVGTVRKGAKRGNMRTRLGMSGVGKAEPVPPIKPFNDNRAMWKKYPTPFIHSNPVPDGDFVMVRHYHSIGTYEKHLKSLEEK